MNQRMHGAGSSSGDPQTQADVTTPRTGLSPVIDASGQAQHRWKPVAQACGIIAVAVGVAIAVYFQVPAVSRGLHRLGALNWGWVAAASVSESVSMLALAVLYRDLLRVNGIRIRLTSIFACCLTANAISMTVPFIGSGMASRRVFLRFRLGGADATAASLVLSVAGIVSTITLATVVTTGAVLSGNPAAAGGGLLAALGMLGAALAVVLQLRTETDRRRLLRVVTFAIRSSQRVTRHPKGFADELGRGVLASVQRMRLGAPTIARAILLGLLNWWADVACLTFAMWAAGLGDLSAGKILIVWTAGVGAATLSPTPAGIGAVEVTMVAAAAAVGIRGADVIAAVLVYRVITLKYGGSLWGVLYQHIERRSRRAADSLPIVD